MSTMRVNHYLRFKSKTKCAKEKIFTSNNMYKKVHFTCAKHNIISSVSKRSDILIKISF